MPPKKQPLKPRVIVGVLGGTRVGKESICVSHSNLAQNPKEVSYWNARTYKLWIKILDSVGKLSSLVLESAHIFALLFSLIDRVSLSTVFRVLF